MSVKRKGRKYEALMDKAHELFWKHGLRRVTVEEICREAGVSKMTFYRYFPDKKELAKEVYGRVVDEGIVKFREILNEPESSAVEKMEKILMLKLEGTSDISREFLADFYRNPETGLSDWVEEKSRQAWMEILDDFRTAQKRGWFRKDFNPEGWLLMAGKLSELVSDEKLADLYGTPQEMIMELARFFTYGIMPRAGSGDRDNK